MQVKAEPIGEVCAASVKTGLRKGKRQWAEEKGSEKKSEKHQRNTVIKGGRRRAPAAGADIPYSLWKSHGATDFLQDCSLWRAHAKAREAAKRNC